MSQREIDLGEWARQALDNPALKEAFERYEAKVLDNLRTCDPLNVPMLQTFQRHLISLNVIRKNLAIMVGEGAQALDRLNFEQQSLKDRTKAAFRRIAA